MQKITDEELKQFIHDLEFISQSIIKYEETPHTRIALIKIKEAGLRLNQEIIDRADFLKNHPET